MNFIIDLTHCGVSVAVVEHWSTESEGSIPYGTKFFLFSFEIHTLLKATLEFGNRVSKLKIAHGEKHGKVLCTEE